MLAQEVDSLDDANCCFNLLNLNVVLLYKELDLFLGQQAFTTLLAHSVRVNLKRLAHLSL